MAQRRQPLHRGRVGAAERRRRRHRGRLTPHRGGHRPRRRRRARRTSTAPSPPPGAAVDEGPWPRLDPAERIDARPPPRRRLRRAPPRDGRSSSPPRWARPSRSRSSPRRRCRGRCSAPSPTSPPRHRWEETRPGYFGQDVALRKEAVGVVAAIVPWNMPQFLDRREAGPGPARRVRRRAQARARDAARRPAAGRADRRGSACPPGVVSVLPGGREVGEHLVGHPGVDKVAFTGSHRRRAAGRRRVRRRASSG